MSAWRRIAIEKLPQLRDAIALSESVGMLWVDLWFEFVKAHDDPADERFIRGVYEFARWTIDECGDSEIATSTVCHFYEHLPTEPAVRKRLPQFMTREQFLGLREVFKYHMSPEMHSEFAGEFLRH